MPAEDVGARAVPARWLWTPEGVVADTSVLVDTRDRIVGLRPTRVGDGVPFDGLVVPGLVNAHTHVELSDLAERVGPGGGFVAWVERMFGVPRGDAVASARSAAAYMRDAGTAWVWDVSNGGDTAACLTEAGLAGVVHHEVLGFAQDVLPEPLLHDEKVRVEGDFLVRPSPHALFSTAPHVVQAAVTATSRVSATIHVAEADEEPAFLTAGEGAFADLLDRLGRPWRWWEAPGTSAVDYLDALGLLGPDLLLVHGIGFGTADVARIAEAGAACCLCPRSNQHVVGRLPDVPAWIAAGVPFALGTDSLASCPDLDVLAEIPVLADAFGHIDPAVWLTAATHGGAAALGTTQRGRVAVGCAPGLVGLHGVTGPADLTRPVSPPRTWLVSPGGSPWGH